MPPPDNMSGLREYRRRDRTTIAAVQLDLDTAGFTYEKWGATQRCKRGDWLVRNGDDTYTVDADVFAKTYREVSLGVYEKFGTVWAQKAARGGSIETKEGATGYEAGDWLVYNDRDKKDGYAIAAERFESLYEPAEK